ncbi:DUF5301 domain-containing protein [Streptococcus gallolyticus]|nr:DUF5301 domain-containing protein [Streptococcus gallolyticus]MBY5040246.1 DUF5301 domain-containing protein [Streptococcus gallolyticus]
MKKIMIAVLLILLSAGVGCWWFRPSSGETPTLPKIREIQEIQMTDSSGAVVHLDMEEKITSFIYFTKDSHKTRQESINDQPSSDLSPYQFDLKLKNGTVRLYIYQKGWKTYLESPYVGIYELDHSLSDWLSGKLDY